MTATALAFSMESMDYEPVTVFFDTGAQKSFINIERSASLQLPTTRNTSFTGSAMYNTAIRPYSYSLIRSSIRRLKTPEMHSENGAVVVATHVLSHIREEYKQDIKNLYELESLGIKLEKDSDEESVLRFMTKYRSSIKIENGKITARFPFMDNVGHLKDNFSVAIKNHHSDYFSQGIIEEVQDHESEELTMFYLPHRHVWTPGKSTQLRVVVDVSSHAKGELSLNDVIRQ
ncbi:hypothetical protein OESDEN_01232 [Oesophagostomum dentatum]|uniref:Peptidase A2 domain-containing protein n=1 Tax=Oesophagostomum dentatum TaxID=61180 RepID=A0A0B1TSH4_OESDE|nr:hypothetical protein OESDEN_01232 [Oesophagostomum dentatum]